MLIFVLPVHLLYISVRPIIFFLSYYSSVLLTNSHEIQILVDS